MVSTPIFATGFSSACAAVLLLCGAVLCAPQCAWAADEATTSGDETGYLVSTAQPVDPPGRIGRLSVLVGQVWIYSPEEGEWVSAERNRPVTSGDRIATDQGARAEVRIGSTVVRVDSDTDLEVQLLDDERLYLRLHKGSSQVRLRDKQVPAQFELYTPEGRFRIEQVGQYRFDRRADSDGDQRAEPGSGRTFATALSGQLQYEGVNQALTIRSGQRAEFEVDGNERARYATSAPERDRFAAWNSARDVGESNAVVQERPATPRYVSPEMTGAEDLDRYGRWQQDADYGVVWYPRDVSPGWAPYSAGRWVWIRPWGWSWVDRAPWGFAPFHYGRWVHRHNVWGWAPGQYQARPRYSPGLVGWVGQPPQRRPGVDISLSIGGGSTLGWFPLGPQDWYEPSYRYREGYGRGWNRWSDPRYERDRRDDRGNESRNDRGGNRGDDRNDHGRDGGGNGNDHSRDHAPRYMNRDAPNAVTMLPPGQDRRVHTPMRTGDAARDAGNQRRWITPRVQNGEPAVAAPVVRNDPGRMPDARGDQRGDDAQGGRGEGRNYDRNGDRNSDRGIGGNNPRQGEPRDGRAPPRAPDAVSTERRGQPAPQPGPRFDPTDRRTAR
jgi:hypothetical protein